MSTLNLPEGAQKIHLPKGAKEIIRVLNSCGYEAYVVGGCVRDVLRGEKPKDWDICTSADPAEMKKCFGAYVQKESGRTFHVVETGIKHGTLTAVVDGEPFEVTSYRIDGEYSDNRRPDQVEFTKSLKEDLSRRDFTINAMALSAEGKLIDEFCGREDLEAGIIRCVGDSKKRFQEDALRIMRGIRFASQLGFEIEKNTAHAMTECRSLLNNIAVERIREEFNKLLCGRGAKEVCEEYRDIISEFIPEVKTMFDFDQKNRYHVYDVWQHTLWAVKNVVLNEKDKNGEECSSDKEAKRDKQLLILKLAAFFHDIGKPIKFTVDEEGRGHFYKHEFAGEEITRQVMNRLKYDNETKSTVCLLVKHHGIVFQHKEKQARKLLNKLGEKELYLLIDLELADVRSQNPVYTPEREVLIEGFRRTVDEVLVQEQCFSMKDMEISGRELMEMGIEQGRYMGIILNTLLKLVIDGKVENRREDLMMKAKELKGSVIQNKK